MPYRPKVKYRYIESQETTGVVKVFDYLIGIVVFGFIWLILNDPINLINLSIDADNEALAMYIWAGSLVIYLVFGAFWFLSSIREK